MRCAKSVFFEAEPKKEDSNWHYLKEVKKAANVRMDDYYINSAFS